MSIPHANDVSKSTSISTIIREVPGRGWQKRALISERETGKPICQRIGGIRFASPLTTADRFKRARPLPRSYQYGSKERPTDCTRLAAESPQARGYPGIKEDCLQMNIFIPEGDTPEGGWPVFFYIYGGFLQFGSPNGEDPVNLYRNSSYQAIFVSFIYRLNAFGFLATDDLLRENGYTGNVGFWDQRLALEFVAAEIGGYGGNSKNITIGGLSAGAYSVFHQLAYSLSLPAEQAHVNKVVMWSNGCGLQPRSLEEAESGYHQLLAAMHIPTSLPSREKLNRLRAAPWKHIITAIKKLPENSFRAITDGQFVRHSLFQEIISGSFAKKMRDRGIKMMIGDCCDEITAYQKISPADSYRSLVQRLKVEFRGDSVYRVVDTYCPSGKLPKAYKTWQDLFGRIYSDLQVHMTERGLLSVLTPVLPAENIFRYRIETRAKMLDKMMPKEAGVTHGSDLAFWFMGNTFGIQGELTDEEIRLAKELVEPLHQFIKNGKVDWGTSRIQEVRLLDGKGVKIIPDPWWDRSIPIWRQIHGLDRQRL